MMAKDWLPADAVILEEGVAENGHEYMLWAVRGPKWLGHASVITQISWSPSMPDHLRTVPPQNLVLNREALRKLACMVGGECL